MLRTKRRYLTRVFLKLIDVIENIDAVRDLIMQDHHVTYHEFETSLGISGTTYIQFVLIDIITGDELWIYVYEPDSKE